MFHRLLVMVSIAMLGIGGSTACATRKFVRTSVGQVNDKVDSLGRAAEETQERTRQNERKIADVDQRSQAAATAAKSAADTANGAQSAANTANSAASAANSVATRANDKVDMLDKASKRIVFEVVLSEDQNNFRFGEADLPAEAKAKLDEMVTQLKADPKAAFFEIAGYTDSVGSPEFNEKLGMDRAEAVKRYLYERHQIPLHRMNTISYGEQNPVGDNKTKSGRALNRRVVVKVVA